MQELGVSFPLIRRDPHYFLPTTDGRHLLMGADRLPYRLPVAGLYACGAGCHPAGSVVGAAGHNAANAVLRDLAISS
jgi:phytoene dehydrogenase-like protein